MQAKFLIVIVGFLISFIVAPAKAGGCTDFGVGGLSISACSVNNGVEIQIAGERVAMMEHRTGANKYYHLVLNVNPQLLSDLRIGVVRDFRVTLQVNSRGPYKDQLIAEICNHDPTYLNIPRGQLGRQQCSSWIVIGPFPYFG